MDKKNEKKITSKSYKDGTYAHTEYFLNGEHLINLTDHKNECGVDWFNNLPDEEDAEIVEEALYNLPHAVDRAIEDKEDD